MKTHSPAPSHALRSGSGKWPTRAANGTLALFSARVAMRAIHRAVRNQMRTVAALTSLPGADALTLDDFDAIDPPVDDFTLLVITGIVGSLVVLGLMILVIGVVFSRREKPTHEKKKNDDSDALYLSKFVATPRNWMETQSARRSGSQRLSWPYIVKMLRQS